MKALLVKDDGLIYAAEVPKEPNITDYGDDEYLYPLAHYTYDMEDYEAAIASAKESAVLVSDQEKAKDLLFKPGMKVIIDKDFSNGGEVTLLEWAKLYATFKHDGEPWWTMKHKLTAKPGIYPIPDLDWTTVDVKIARILSTDGKHKQMPLTGPVAILKESTPSTEQESQEDIMYSLVEDYLEVQGEWTLGDALKMLCNKFTITRKS